MYSQQYSGYGYAGSYSGYQNFQQQDSDNWAGASKSRFNRFRVNILPAELEGIKVLWSLIGACDTGNQGLFYLVQRTLINIYTNLAPELSAQRQDINDSFI